MLESEIFITKIITLKNKRYSITYGTSGKT